MDWLIDNNVPRSVTVMLRDLGHEAAEVREVLGQEAPDDAVAAYAAAQRLVLVTHDRGCARDARKAGIPHVWLRTREWQDRDRIREALPELIRTLRRPVRIVLFLTTIRVEPKS